MIRPIFISEIIGDIEGDFKPRYDISPVGHIDLKNPVIVQGTPVNADTLNNLFDMDNLDSMAGNLKDTIFNPDGSITENIREHEGIAVNATKTTKFLATGEVEETTIVYNNAGEVVLRKTTVKTKFGEDGSITEVVS